MSESVEFDARHPPPGMHRLDVVLVTGPALAGVGSMVAALRVRMPGRSFAEAHEMPAGAAPTAVVFVASAVAPIVESDCALVDLAALQTDVVIGVVSKIDDHRDWRGALAANRERLAARYRPVPWVGAAAAPRLGEPMMDEIVEVLDRELRGRHAERRNNLRAWESHVLGAMDRVRVETDVVDTLRVRRDELVRERRLTRSGSTIAVRSRIQQARVALMYLARHRCAAARTELLTRAAATRRREIPDFERSVRQRCRELAAEADGHITTHTRDVVAGLGLAEPPPSPPGRPVSVPDPALTSRRLETQLMTVLGAGFGLGVAVVVSRLLAGLVPGQALAGLVVGGLAGLAITVWVVRVRALLHDRAVLDRWVSEAITTVRSNIEEQVATRMQAVEAALASACADLADAQRAALDRRVARITAEMRAHADENGRTEADRDHAMSSLQRVLDAIRKGLPEMNTTESLVTRR